MRIGGLAFSTLSGLFAKACSVLVMIALVPLATENLSAEGFGIWMTTTSLLMVLQFADFGVGNGLVSILSSHISDSTTKILKTAVSTAAMVLIVTGCIFLLVSVTVLSFVNNWQSVFKVTNIDHSTIKSTLLFFTLFLAASIPAVVGQKILWGFQEVYIANIWQVFGNVLTLILFAIVVFWGGGLIWMVAATVIGPFVALLISSADQLIRRRRWLIPSRKDISREMASRLVRLSAGWTIYQLLFFVATSADGIFVTRIFGAEAMGTYGLMMRMMGGLALALFFTVPLWPVFANAIARNDQVLVKRYFRLSLMICGSIGVLTGALLFLLAKPIARIWVGPDLIPENDLVAAFSFWAFIYNIWAGISSLMGNELMIKRMVFVAGIGSLISIFLKIPLASALGTAGVCWASVIGVGFSSLVGFYMLVMELKRLRLDSCTSPAN